ncbi:MAG: metal ABC transporter ATP-binding protein [Deltaproteobacteria bacterium]|jgi:zinc transport system ATP-binding protein|nr:metal ABC transporter ATP-binding protein [Deltaproteobacteria bacterium]
MDNILNEALEDQGNNSLKAIEINDLGVNFGHYNILKNVTLKIPARKQTVIIGPNGAGKSTLVLAILGETSHTGSITFFPEKPVFGYVPQRLDFDRNLPLSVSEFMALGRTWLPMWITVPRKIRERNLAYLEMVRATHLLDRHLGALSGGETQRVFLARALLENPDILILDEPATGVDMAGEQLLCEILEDFKRDFTIVMVSHDLATARAHGDWIICLNHTVVAEGPPEKIFRPQILSQAFGFHQSLLFETEA